MDTEFKKWFLEFISKNVMYILTGSDVPKTVEQIGQRCIQK